MKSKPYPLSKVDAADLSMELSCGCTKMGLVYLREIIGNEATEELVYSTRMNLNYIEDRRNWVSYGYYFRFLAAAVASTKNDMAGYEIGKCVGRQKCFGPLESLVGRTVSTGTLYRFARTLNTGALYRMWLGTATRWSRGSTWEITFLNYQRCLIRVKNNLQAQDKNNCLCIQGVIESLPQFAGMPNAKVTEILCACNGADACTYDISWVETATATMSARLSLCSCILGTLAAILLDASLWVWGATGLLWGFFLGRSLDFRDQLRRVAAENDRQAASLEESLKDIEELNEDLVRKVEARTCELTVANTELGNALAEIKENQARKIEIERHRAFGLIAAGMAHEINNPLNAIKLSLQAIRENAGGKGSDLKALELADRASNRCKRIISDLLSVSREPRQENFARVEDVIKKTLEVFEREQAPGIVVEKQVEPDLPSVVLDRTQIQQALMNLLKNASDAMNDSGVITVGLRQGTADEVIISVTDQGPGISSEVRKHLFEPFFSTKSGSGGGLGLGLAISYQLVSKNGGTIEVASEPGTGTTMLIKLKASAVKRALQPALRPVPPNLFPVNGQTDRSATTDVAGVFHAVPALRNGHADRDVEQARTQENKAKPAG